MGCGGSKEKLEAHKSQLSTQDFSSAQGPVWNSADVSAGVGVLRAAVVNKNSSTIQTTEGKVLLNVQLSKPAGTKDALAFTENGQSAIVVLVCCTGMATFGSGTPHTWDVWGAKPSKEGQQPESTPIGTPMFKWGTYTQKIDKPLFFMDVNGSEVFHTKCLSYSACLSVGPDGSKPAAAIEGIEYAKGFGGTVTFAKGVDPIIALVSGYAALLFSG